MSSFTTPRLARRTATMNLATAVSTPAVTTARSKATEQLLILLSGPQGAGPGRTVRARKMTKKLRVGPR